MRTAGDFGAVQQSSGRAVSSKRTFMDVKPGSGADPSAPVAADLPTHGYVITKPVRGSDIPADYSFVLTRDEIYVPIAVRRPKGSGPWPAIIMGRGNGRGGLPLVEQKVALYSTLQDKMIARGYVVAYVNYRNEIPYHYETRSVAQNVADDISGE